MSGPWDRPSSPSPDDQDWPAEDFASSPPGPQPSEPWSADDPWQESRQEPSTGWDAWPSAVEPTDDYVIEEPPPPSSDPWAESWADDVPGVPSGPEPSEFRDGGRTSDEPRDRYSSSDDVPEAAATSEPLQRPPDHAPYEPESTWRDEAAPGSAPSEPAVEPTAEQSPADVGDRGPRVEPWSADTDPWGSVDDDLWGGLLQRPAEDAAPPSPVAEVQEGPTAATAEAEPVEAPSAVEPSTPDEPDQHPFEIPAGLEHGSSHDEPAPIVPTWEADAEELETTPDGEPPEPAAEGIDYRSAYESLFPTTLPPVADDAPPAEPAAPAVPAEAQPEAEPRLPPPSAAEPSPTEPPIMDQGVDEGAGPEIAADDPGAEFEAPAVHSQNAPAPPGPVWAADLWEEEPAAAAARPALNEEDESDEADRDASWTPAAAEPSASDPPWVSPVQPAADAPAEAVESEPGQPEPDWQPEDWRDTGAATQVLPASWSPPRPATSDELAELQPEAGRIRTSLGGATDVEGDTDEHPSTAEQAVPWLIGVILLLAGMVIVLLALIFAGDASLGGGGAAASGSIDIFAAEANASLPPIETASPTPSPTATPAPPAPTSSESATIDYGDIPIVYQGRSTALAPIYLLRRDFAVEEEPVVLAQDPTLDVRAFAWAPDGTVGAGLYADLLISVEPGTEKRNLADGIVSLTFGDDASTVYAVRITEDGGDDVATILAIDYESGETEELASVSYARPGLEEESALEEARFLDDGGAVRLYWIQDDTLHLRSLGAGAWDIDPASGEIAESSATPVLWSPGGGRRISTTVSDGVTTINVHDGASEEPSAATSVEGLVSHVRWAPGGERVTFTVGRSTPGGGVLQDLFLWDLQDGTQPMQMTDSGAAFGGEWLGGTSRWERD